MKNWMKVVGAAAFCASAALAHADSAASAASALSTQEVTESAGSSFPAEFVKRFPAAGGAKFVRAFPGFWAVVKGGEVFFVRDDLSILITGNVIDLPTHHSISSEILQANQPKIDVSSFDLRDAIRFGNGKHKLYVFSDPDCPYCRKLDGELMKLTDVTIYLFPFPLASLHPNAANVAETIWCQKDRAAAWSAYQKLARESSEPAVKVDAVGAPSLPQASHANIVDAWHAWLHAQRQPEQPTCDNPIERNLALGKKLDIYGTPALIFEDGTLVPGLEAADKIQAQLARSAAVVAKAGK
jgi:thiol:disulfide interchange protein DsbC